MTQSLLDSTPEFLARCRSDDAPISSRDIFNLNCLIFKTCWQRLLCSFTAANEFHQLSTLLQYQESLLSPIRRLPPELLTKIFTFIVEENPMTFGDYSPGTRLNALRISHVCCWWHTLVVSQPSLWSFIRVDIRNIPTKGSVFFRKDVIPRSEFAALSITLEFSHHNSINLVARDILNDLGAQANRWKHLKLLVSSPDGMRQLDNLIPGRALTHPRDTAGNISPLPLLESLTIISINSLSPADAESFNCCPRLRELHITGSSVNASNGTFHFLNAIDSRNLIILDIKAALDCPIVDLLRACPLLQTLTVGALRGTGAPLPECFFHTHLTTLNLCCIDEHFPKDVWQSVRLPSLAYLDVVMRAKEVKPTGLAVFKVHLKPTLDALMNMLICSGCRLQKASTHERRGGTAVDYVFLRIFFGRASNASNRSAVLESSSLDSGFIHWASFCRSNLDSRD
ncbi:hypothetical protein BDP27DRAFT_1476778 [Rhodocollybia butyracea]|uniref:F-box domain-containing protein n=1 Tax=Rhodocollybia butyracea TaxID=206335 RepID=A0A9P5Q3H2_9AGAR|nr:hypothetical protein BDP27DRAFT_1476778 [Rhodocollybia butyracea]